MGRVHGKTAVFKIDNSAGTLVDLSTYGDNSELERTVGLDEITGFGDTAVKRIVGLQDGSFTVSGSYDGAAAAIDAHLSGIYALAATQTFEYGPESSTSGLVKYSGECRLESYKVTAPVNGRVSWEAKFLLDGAVTRGTWA